MNVSEFQTFEAFGGETFKARIPIVDTAGNPANLAGATVTCAIVAPTPTSAALVTLTIANSGVVVDTVNSTVTIILTPTQTTAIETALDNAGAFKPAGASGFRTAKCWFQCRVTATDVSDVKHGYIEVIKSLIG